MHTKIEIKSMCVCLWIHALNAHMHARTCTHKHTHIKRFNTTDLKQILLMTHCFFAQTSTSAPAVRVSMVATAPTRLTVSRASVPLGTVALCVKQVCVVEMIFLLPNILSCMCVRACVRVLTRFIFCSVYTTLFILHLYCVRFATLYVAKKY